MPAIKPCLWFPSDAEAAASRYVSIFPNSRVVHVMRAGGVAVAVDFELDGRAFLAINGRREPAFTDAVPFLVPCETQDEIDRYWAALVDGGEEGQCGWLKDRFGVSWQIAPADIAALLGGPDPAAAGRAMQAMLGMKKLDVAALRRARDGDAAAATS